MFMRDWGVDDYGLVLDKKIMKHMASEICKGFKQSEYDSDPFPFHEEVQNKAGVEYISEFSGEAYAIDNKGQRVWSDWKFYSNDIIYYIPVLNYPGLFTRPYDSMDDIVAEMKDRAGKYLPPNFDIRSNIRQITGTYYG